MKARNKVLLLLWWGSVCDWRTLLVTSILKSSKSESFSAGRRLYVTHQYPRGKGEGGASQGVWL